MSFDKEILKDLAVFTESAWPVEVLKIEYLTNESTADCFKVYASDGAYFLKQFQIGYTTFRADKEAEVCRLLSHNLLPVSEIIDTKDSKTYAVYNDRIYQLQPFVDGYTPSHNSLNESILCQAASLLGDINYLLQTTETRCGFDSEWLLKFNESQYIEQYEHTLYTLGNSRVNDDIKEKIKNDLKFRIELTQRMSSLSHYFVGLTYSVSHGDYTPSQLICRGDNIAKIVDFSNTCRMPVALELIRFYFLASTDCKNVYDFDIGRFKRYIAMSCDKFRLSDKDLCNMPFIYLYYMGRNRFLYRDFLKTNDIRDYMISSQRVDISKYLFDNADSISSQLISL